MARKKPTIERHHRRPQSRGGTNHQSNISHVRQSEHRAFHQLFSAMLPDEVASLLTDVWIDSDFYMVAFPRKKKKSRKPRKRAFCTTCNCEVLKCMDTTNDKE